QQSTHTIHWRNDDGRSDEDSGSDEDSSSDEDSNSNQNESNEGSDTISISSTTEQQGTDSISVRLLKKDPSQDVAYMDVSAEKFKTSDEEKAELEKELSDAKAIRSVKEDMKKLVKGFRVRRFSSSDISQTQGIAALFVLVQIQPSTRHASQKSSSYSSGKSQAPHNRAHRPQRLVEE
ncbi:MAG: hypothetical protein Q9174_004008, partial [Haloplaca sp. 1 TL-2023]